MFQMQVGTTHSGQLVYFFYDHLGPGDVHCKSQEFSSVDDLFDAYAIFEALAYEEFRRNGFGPVFRAYIHQAEAYLEKIGDAFEKCKHKYAIATSMDLLSFGKRLIQVCSSEPVKRQAGAT